MQLIINIIEARGWEWGSHAKYTRLGVLDLLALERRDYVGNFGRRRVI